MHGPSSVLDPTTQTQTLYIPFASPPTPSPSPVPSASHGSGPTNPNPNPSTSTSANNPNPSAHPRNPNNPNNVDPTPARRAFLTSILVSCTPGELHFLSTALAPLLAAHPPLSRVRPRPRDALTALPPELGLHILLCVDDPRTLARAGTVCRSWRALAADEAVWRRLCVMWGFMDDEAEFSDGGEGEGEESVEEMEAFTVDLALEWLVAASRRKAAAGPGPQAGKHRGKETERPLFSYRAHFRRNYVISMNWRHGGRLLRSHELPTLSAAAAHVVPPLLPPPPLAGAQHLQLHYPPHQHQPPAPANPYTHIHTYNGPYAGIHALPTIETQPPDNGVVTSLAIDREWVVVGLASSRIHVFSAHTGVLARTLVGHEAGVWGVCLVSAGGEPGVRRGVWSVESEGELKSGEGVGTKSRKGKGKARREGRDAKGKGKGKGAGGSKKGEPDGQTRGTGREGGDGVGYLDHLVPPSLRMALGLEPDVNADSASTSGSGSGSGSESSGASTGGRRRTDGGVGGRGVVDEDAEEGSGSMRWDRGPGKRARGGDRRHEVGDDALDATTTEEVKAGPAYAPERASDPAFASVGWGQPGALVVSGGCDKVVKVWDVRSGHCIYTLRGHTATIRCLRVLHGRAVAVSGSRDGTLRVWDVRRGAPLRVLRGHTGSVRCVDVNGRRAVSGSYDTTARIWDVDTGECLFVLRGHFHQIYAVAFDGVRVATGGLDTTVRVWDAETGTCTALLQGHSALVCQLQLARDVLVTGGSDGRVVTFALGTLRAAHRVLAHDASVTALQRRGGVLVTGGNDGRVRVWEAGAGAGADGGTGREYVSVGTSMGAGVGVGGSVGVVDTGVLVSAAAAGGEGEVGGRFVRDMWEGECVWKVAVARGGGACAVMGRRAGKTVMEVWSFRLEEGGGG